MYADRRLKGWALAAALLAVFAACSGKSAGEKEDESAKRDAMQMVSLAINYPQGVEGLAEKLERIEDRLRSESTVKVVEVRGGEKQLDIDMYIYGDEGINSIKRAMLDFLPEAIYRIEHL